MQLIVKPVCSKTNFSSGGAAVKFLLDIDVFHIYNKCDLFAVGLNSNVKMLFHLQHLCQLNYFGNFSEKRDMVRVSLFIQRNASLSLSVVKFVFTKNNLLWAKLRQEIIAFYAQVAKFNLFSLMTSPMSC